MKTVSSRKKYRANAFSSVGHFTRRALVAAAVFEATRAAVERRVLNVVMNTDRPAFTTVRLNEYAMNK